MFQIPIRSKQQITEYFGQIGKQNPLPERDITYTLECRWFEEMAACK